MTGDYNYKKRRQFCNGVINFGIHRSYVLALVKTIFEPFCLCNVSNIDVFWMRVKIDFNNIAMSWRNSFFASVVFIGAIIIAIWELVDAVNSYLVLIDFNVVTFNSNETKAGDDTVADGNGAICFIFSCMSVSFDCDWTNFVNDNAIETLYT